MSWQGRYEDGVVPEPVKVAPLIPAATVVVLRDHPGGGVEALMVRRNAKLEFAGGHWVFPGGRVDASDRVGLAAGDAEGAARQAAVREANEEAGIDLTADGLVWFSHWTPPPISPKRFGTYFFATKAPEGELVVTIDGGEIHDHGWMRPRDAMVRRDVREIQLSPPTWITLEELARHDTVDAALAVFRSRAPEHFATHIALVGERVLAVYDGDVAYESGDVEAVGPRHRLWMDDHTWHYERDDWTA